MIARLKNDDSKQRCRMNETEGVIKYQLLHTDKPLSPLIDTANLNVWRHILYRLQLIGRISGRYGGLGYGNLSERLENGQFLVSGTQTGELAMLKREHFAVVEQAWPESNRLVSHGLTKPSSEALTHAILYRQQAVIGAVIHAHCPEIWRNTLALQIPYTEADIAYGTVEMVNAVKQLLSNKHLLQHGIFSMLGHEDGIVSFGPSPALAATALIQCLSRAIAIELKR